MVGDDEGYFIPLLVRRRFIKKLRGLGLIVSDGHIYIDNPKKGDPKIENLYLPVGLMSMFYYKPIGLDEPLFEEIHNKILEVRKSVIKT